MPVAPAVGAVTETLLPIVGQSDNDYVFEDYRGPRLCLDEMAIMVTTFDRNMRADERKRAVDAVVVVQRCRSACRC